MARQLISLMFAGVCGQPFSPKNPLAPPDPKTFTAKVPVHMLPSNKVAFYFDWGKYEASN